MLIKLFNESMLLGQTNLQNNQKNIKTIEENEDIIIAIITLTIIMYVIRIRTRNRKKIITIIRV